MIRLLNSFLNWTFSFNRSKKKLDVSLTVHFHVLSVHFDFQFFVFYNRSATFASASMRRCYETLVFCDDPLWNWAFSKKVENRRMWSKYFQQKCKFLRQVTAIFLENPLKWHEKRVFILALMLWFGPYLFFLANGM